LQLFGNVQIQIAPRLGGGQIEVLVFPLMQLANDLQQLGTRVWISIVSHDMHFFIEGMRILEEVNPKNLFKIII
jgi:hypothetical protein